MQHPSSKASLTDEKESRKRDREERHTKWKAMMFPSRPPPPHVPASSDTQHDASFAAALSKPSFQLVDLIRRSSIAVSSLQTDSADQARSSGIAGESGSTEAAARSGEVAGGKHGEGSSFSPVSSASCSPQFSALEERLVRELNERQPFLDTKRTTDPAKTLVVLRLPPTAQEDDLVHFGERYGRVVATRVVRDVTTGDPKGYGFIQFAYEKEMEKAVRDSRQSVLHLRPRIKGRIVLLQAEKGRAVALPGEKRSCRVPARLVRVCDKVDEREVSRHAARHTDGHEEQAASCTAHDSAVNVESVLDNLEDYLAAFS